MSRHKIVTNLLGSHVRVTPTQAPGLQHLHGRTFEIVGMYMEGADLVVLLKDLKSGALEYTYGIHALVVVEAES